MKESPFSDEPVADPDNDLLGARIRAQTLARHVIDIPAPFTIGIHGQWGEGKTSFVNLFKRYLDDMAAARGLKKIKFIRFSAWGHSTSDAVWRALILKIAQELYSGSDKPGTNGLAAAMSLETTDGASPPNEGAALQAVAADLGTPLAAAANGQAAPSAQTGKPSVDAANNQPSSADADGESTASAVRKGWALRLLDFLNQEAYVLRKAPPPPNPQQDYKDLIARLDRTAPASVGKDAERQMQLNHEVVVLAAVNAAVSAMGILSPLVATVRSFFSIGEKVDLAELLQKEKSEATRETIQSVQEFKREFRALFETKAEPYYQVFVFVDDLDRCMPDVALDVLEAIKIFLGEEKCVFLVAADEQLIGEGLRLRFKDLLAGAHDQRSQAYITQKGKEYFEKIIQLRVRVPQRGPTAAHRFVAAQFPMCAAATDLIQIAVSANPQIAVDANPRRLKQYCHQLSYQEMVAEMETEGRRDGSAPAP